MAAEDRAPSPSARTQLTDLVRERKAALGLSYERLAKRCVDPETGEMPVKSSWLHRLVTGLPVISPDLSQLQALAAGLDVPLGRIQDAAGAQFFGIDVVPARSGEVRALVERADRMSPEQLEQLLRLLDTFTPGDQA
ncbi:helix-turn-helix domain-containing protein [Streptomyces sp. ISL-98]|uniref:helix-turn-helix domain-containing protein n=1 Tax=Streptomyces sp. ISL-98 TaxID=2819192 RepID=UPI001BECA80D|nr:helix-turn-helix domain-containing protein [Streptomyces sp. ISL-98]MBT2508875.1 helix-turn-helix domain-containing protein [Streptomyces sp. ISL-98]